MRKKSLIHKVSTSSTAIILCGFIVALAANYWQAAVQAKKSQQRQLSRQLDQLSHSLEGPLWTLDEPTTRIIGDAYIAGADNVSLRIVTLHNNETVYEKHEQVETGTIFGQQDIFHDDEKIGYVELGLSGSRYSDVLSRLFLFSLLLASFLIVALTIVLRMMFRSHLQVPLQTLERWTDRLASGEYEGTPPVIDLEELEALAKKFFKMSDEIRSREASLQTSERKFRGLFENTEVSIWDEDLSEVVSTLDELKREGVSNLRQYFTEHPLQARDMSAMVRVNRVNAATLELFGAKDQQDMLCRIDKTFGPNTMEAFIDELCAIWNGEKSFRGETNYLSLDGKLIHAIISFNIPEDCEAFKNLPVSIIDITDLKQAEDELVKYRDHLQTLVDEQTRQLRETQSELLQQERLATLGKLTATVSHELRNPLGTIQTALFSIDDALDGHESHRVNRSLELAERSIRRCVTIIEELNSYAREKTLDCNEVDVDEWLTDVLEEFVTPDNVSIELDLSCGVRALYDQEKMRQVVVNLVNNAVDALQSDGSKGHLIKVSSNRLNDHYELIIEDEGCGMSEATIGKMFEPLFSTKGFGVGLGMVVVKNIVEKHLGTIHVESQLNEGSRVTVRLPISSACE